MLEEASPAEFEALRGLANVNLRRQARLLRAIVIAYVTVPLSLTATAGVIAPDQIERLLRDYPREAFALFFASTAGALWYVAAGGAPVRWWTSWTCSAWRVVCSPTPRWSYARIDQAPSRRAAVGAK